MEVEKRISVFRNYEKRFEMLTLFEIQGEVYQTEILNQVDDVYWVCMAKVLYYKKNQS